MNYHSIKKTFEINLDANMKDKSMEISQSNETVLDDVTNNALNFMLKYVKLKNFKKLRYD
ncbi:hypothetical protein UM89_21925 [Bacillus subtilis]|nr:hypothetical protein UM89_21925 [Bacillus subtilis]